MRDLNNTEQMLVEPLTPRQIRKALLEDYQARIERLVSLKKSAAPDEWAGHGYNAKRRARMFVIGDVMKDLWKALLKAATSSPSAFTAGSLK